MTRRPEGVELDARLELLDGAVERGPWAPIELILSTQICVVGRGRRRRQGPRGRSGHHVPLEPPSHRFGNFALQRQHIANVAIEGLGPEVKAVSSLHELGGDPILVGHHANGSLEQDTNV